MWRGRGRNKRADMEKGSSSKRVSSRFRPPTCTSRLVIRARGGHLELNPCASEAPQLKVAGQRLSSRATLT